MTEQQDALQGMVPVTDEDLTPEEPDEDEPVAPFDDPDDEFEEDAGEEGD